MQSPDLWTRQDTASLPTLTGVGPYTTLDEPGISLCGSRATDDRGIAIAQAAGRLAADRDLTLVSGYAKGVDLAGHVACVESGGRTIAVLAEGIGKFRLRRELQDAIEPWDDIWGRLTAISQFEDHDRWTVWRAMQRNDTICALGRVLVAIDPGQKGGTLDAVKKAVKRETPLVIAWSNPSADRQHLAPFEQRGVPIVQAERELLATVQELLDNPSPDAAKEVQLPLMAPSD